MKRQDIIKAVAGTLVLASSLLGYFAHREWLFAAMFVGANLLQYAFSGWCLLDRILEKARIGDGR